MKNSRFIKAVKKWGDSGCDCKVCSHFISNSCEQGLYLLLMAIATSETAYLED